MKMNDVCYSKQRFTTFQIATIPWILMYMVCKKTTLVLRKSMILHSIFKSIHSGRNTRYTVVWCGILLGGFWNILGDIATATWMAICFKSNYNLIPVLESKLNETNTLPQPPTIQICMQLCPRLCCNLSPWHSYNTTMYSHLGLSCK